MFVSEGERRKVAFYPESADGNLKSVKIRNSSQVIHQEHLKIGIPEPSIQVNESFIYRSKLRNRPRGCIQRCRYASQMGMRLTIANNFKRLKRRLHLCPLRLID